jgi:hypothetical protein
MICKGIETAASLRQTRRAKGQHKARMLLMLPGRNAGGRDRELQQHWRRRRFDGSALVLGASLTSTGSHFRQETS